MSFNIVRGHFAPPAAVQIKELAKDVKGIAKKFTTTPDVLHDIATQSGNEPDFFYQCVETIIQKNPSMMPAALKQYFLPQWVEDQEHRLTQEQKNQINAQMLALKLNASLSDEDLKKIKLKNWIEFNRSIGNIGSLKEFIKCNKTNKDYWKELLANLKNLFGVNKLKVKEDYDIKTYFYSDNFKKTETDETNPKFIIGDSKEIIEKQKEVFNSLQLPIELINSQGKLRTTFETLFEKGRKSKDYSFYSVPLNQTIFNNTIQIIEKEKGNIGLNSAYKKAVMEYQQSQFKNWGIDKKMVTDEQGNEIGSLITIPQTKKDESNFENRYQVIQTHSCESWCIHQANAESYIEDGKMIIYMPKNSKENVGFSYKDNKIVEIETRMNIGIRQESIRQILDVLRLKTNKTLIEDLSPSQLDKLNKVAAKEKIDLSDINNTYLGQFIDDDNNISKLLPSDLKGINSIFAENPDYTDKVEKINNVYINKLIGDNENISRLSPTQLKIFNDLFKDMKDYQENVNTINNVYINKLTGDKDKISRLSPTQLKNINVLFKDMKDYQENVNTINNVYINKLTGDKDKISRLSPTQLKIFNELFKDMNDYQEDVKTINNAYLNQFINNGEKLSKLSPTQLKNINVLFKDMNDYQEDVKTINNAYLNQFINNDNDKMSNLEFDDFKNINNMFKANEKYTDKLKAFNEAYLDQFINNGEKLSKLLSFELKYINEAFVASPHDENKLKAFNEAYLNQFINNDNDKMSNLELKELKEINELFKANEKYTDKLKAFNDAYLDKFINDSKKLSKLSLEHFQEINELFKANEKYTDKLKAFNDAYLDQFINDSKKLSKLSLEHFQEINELFTGNEEYEERLKAFNNAYINQLVGNDEEVSRLLPNQLLYINELFVDNQDCEESLKAFNNAYLNQFINNGEKLSKLSPSELNLMFYIFQDYAGKLKKIKEFMSINAI